MNEYLNGIKSVANEFLLFDLCGVVAKYVEPTDREIGIYNMDWLLDSVTSLKECVYGAGISGNLEFMGKVMRLVRKHVREIDSSLPIIEQMRNMIIPAEYVDHMFAGACAAGNKEAADYLFPQVTSDREGLRDAYINGHSELVIHLLNKGVHYSRIWEDVCKADDAVMAEKILGFGADPNIMIYRAILANSKKIIDMLSMNVSINVLAEVASMIQSEKD